MSDTPTSSRQIVVFSLGETEYCLPVGAVKEIIKFVAPQPTASRWPWMRGVINLRGSVIPVCDLAMRIRRAEQPNENPKAKVLIIDGGDRLAGVVVSDVDEVRTIDASHIEPAPQTSDSLIREIAKVDGRLVMVLDPDEMLDGLLRVDAEAA